MSEVAGIAIRWALYADLGLLFGLPLFALYAPGGGRTVQRHLPMGAMVACLACFGLLLSALGFAVQAAAMSGLPLTQPDFALLGDLINETAMGAALKARLVALLVLLFCVLLYRRQSRPAWVGALAAFLALVMPKAATGDMERVSLAEEALTGFSLVGTIIVALLILTGMGASHKTGTDIR